MKPLIPYSITIEELAQLGSANIPKELISSSHLIYNSPAALAFNSPGAQGFGVKRAGLAIPGSIMLLIGPGCCGRNTTILSEMGGYSERFFYYQMDETDIVTGRHLRKIASAIKEILATQTVCPSVVMVCMTCVDALLGTDMEQVCKKATQKIGVPVVPCYMYALTREGRKPPMVDVRRAVYSLLEKQTRNRRTVNLIGYFSPLQDDCELYEILKNMGIHTIHELARCKDYDAYKTLSQANFNIILHPEARLAAQDMQERLGIPSIELTRLYQVAKIHTQYQALGRTLGVSVEDTVWWEQAKEIVSEIKQRCAGIRVSIGEMQNGNAYEMALALTKYGFAVKEIFANISENDYVYIRHLTELTPLTKVYSNLSPSMIYYEDGHEHIDVTIGKDCSYYHPHAVHVHWDEDIQPFGYAGVISLLKRIQFSLRERNIA